MHAQAHVSAAGKHPTTCCGECMHMLPKSLSFPTMHAHPFHIPSIASSAYLRRAWISHAVHLSTSAQCSQKLPGLRGTAAPPLHPAYPPHGPFSADEKPRPLATLTTEPRETRLPSVQAQKNPCHHQCRRCMPSHARPAQASWDRFPKGSLGRRGNGYPAMLMARQSRTTVPPEILTVSGFSYRGMFL